MLARSVLTALLFIGAAAQDDIFGLPDPARYAPKPTVPPEYSKFFELDGHARELVDSLIGPRPGGFFPEKTFDIGSPSDVAEAGPRHQISGLERTLEQLFTAPEPSSNDPGLPPGFGQGFSLANNNKKLTSFQRSPVPKHATKDEEIEGSGADSKSSIGGIPKFFPKLPKAPVAVDEENNSFFNDEARAAGGLPIIPGIRSSPDVPEGGFLPQGDVRRSPASVSEVASSIDDVNPSPEEYGGLSEETSGGSSGGLIGTILSLVGLGNKRAAAQANGQPQEPADPNALGRAVSSLIGGENSPLPVPAKSALSNVLYKALTNNDEERNSTIPLELTDAQKAAIGENLEMIQNLIIQPSSPLCTTKPEPVPFELDAFMGQCPPLSTGPCSMVSYKKLSDVNGGGVSSIFEVFEYTTDGTPYTKPRITSGYSIIKGAGQLLYRTTSSQDDVKVYVIGVGPLNDEGMYEYAVMSLNCNYPLYVFARDPVDYKIKHEARVNLMLEKKGILNGFSRLFNIVSPVDNTMCTFPPSLFNVQG